MQKEIEAKFLNQDHEEIRSKLRKLGAICQHPKSMMRRTTFDYPDKRLLADNAWVRLREELDGSIELTLKRVKTNTLSGMQESMIKVNDYEDAKNFMLSIGLVVKSEQESKREVWMLGNTEVMLDEWPWVKPFIEIEAPTEAEVKKVAKKLGLNWSDAEFGGVTPVYTAEYKITREEFESLDCSIKFDLPVPTVLRSFK